MRDLAENPHGRRDLRESVREMAGNPHRGGEARAERFGSSAKTTSESGKRSSCGIIMWHEERKEPENADYALGRNRRRKRKDGIGGGWQTETRARTADGERDTDG